MAKENPNTRGAERNLTPLQKIFLHPDQFDPDKLLVNELEQSDGKIIAKIPQIPNRICRRKKAGSDEYYIELILSHRYDPETKQNRNKKVIIGEDISYYLKGMMVANDNYHEYFDVRGNVLPHIKALWEEEKQKQQEASLTATDSQPNQQPTSSAQTEPTTPKASATQPRQATQKPTTQAQTTQIQTPPPPPPEPDEEGEADEVQIKELREREKVLDAREQELNQLQAELESEQMTRQIRANEAARDHITLLYSMVDSYKYVVEAQAKRKPDMPMSLKQVRMINEVLQDLKTTFKGSEAEDFLHLAEEPDKGKDIPGTTYGEMALLLNTYNDMINHFISGKMRTK